MKEIFLLLNVVDDHLKDVVGQCAYFAVIFGWDQRFLDLGIRFADSQLWLTRFVDCLFKSIGFHKTEK